ncbi:MAG: hypothetical protein PHG25_01045 [Candidatus Pacebacteria bacterium]|nr:hypothetical protein [Candidatus Paceibacterota bacterium]
MKTQKKSKPHVNVGVIGHFHARDDLFVSAILACIGHSERGDVILVVPEDTTDEQLKGMIKECVNLHSLVVTPISSPPDTATIKASLAGILESIQKLPAPVPAYQGTPWPPLKKRVPLKYLPGHKHRVSIHSSRARR